MSDRPDVTYRYDGSFDGFLCCVFEAVYSGTVPGAITADDTLLRVRPIVTDADKADRVLTGIRGKIAPAAAELVRTAFRADRPDKEIALLKYLLLGFSAGSAILNMLAHPDVAPVTRMVRSVRNETHRMKEFVRFSDYGGALVAVIEPQHDVLELVAPHFADRLRSETFLLYDAKRRKAYAFDKGCGGILYIDRLELPAATDEERAFRRLWKLFFDTVEIQARHNERCQNTHLPKLYRKHMTEFKDD